MATVVTQNELIEAVRAAMAPSPTFSGGVTAGEIAEETGRGITLVRRALGRMIAAGTAEVVTVMRPRIDGMLTQVPAYKLKVPLT